MKFDIENILNEYYKRAEIEGVKLTSQWRKRAIKRLQQYAKNINPFLPKARKLFGVRTDKVYKDRIFMYGINPNTALDPEYQNPGTGLHDGRPYHVYIESPRARWITITKRKEHLETLGSPVAEFGVSNFFTHKSYTFGIRDDIKTPVAVHSVRNLAELVTDTADIEQILLDAAREYGG